MRIFLLTIFCCLTGISFAIERECLPNLGTLKHIEGNGIGYNNGYTSIEGFFPVAISGYNVPFLDLRGHIFDNGEFASNVGVGVRHIGKNRVWGINGYFDYRDYAHKAFRQLSFGVESLGCTWDFRANGYFPLDLSTPCWADFSNFSGNSLFCFKQRDIALRGFNAEAGLYLPWRVIPYSDLYLAAGPYFLQRKNLNSWGGQARLACDLSDYIRFEIQGSYDQLFGGIIQGQVSLRIPFGGKFKGCRRGRCFKRSVLQRVERREIIPIKRSKDRELAINPATGLPYQFLFVNNTSTDSQGTFQHPYATLNEAEVASTANDVIYVFAGDGTTTGMDQGIVLKDGQYFFGAASGCDLPSECGPIELPASGTMPQITNSVDPIVLAANHTEICGFHLIANDVRGVDITDVSNVLVHNNFFEVNSVPASAFFNQGVRFTNSGGNLSIVNNTFELSNFGRPVFGIHVISTLPDANYLIENNLFTSFENVSGVTGIEFGLGRFFGRVSVGDFQTLRITNNRFFRMGDQTPGVQDPAKAIGGYGFGGSGQIFLTNNVFDDCYGGAPQPFNSIVALRVREVADLQFTVTNNQWVNSQSPTFVRSITIQTTDATAACAVLLTGNVSDSVGVPGYRLDNAVGGTFTTIVGSNVGVVNEVNTN